MRGGDAERLARRRREALRRAERVARRQHRRSRLGRGRSARAGRAADPPGAAVARRDGTCMVRFRVTPTASRRGRPGSEDDRALGAHFFAFEYGSRDEDRRRRLAALAPARGDRELHPRLARRARRGGRRRHEIVAFAPTSLEGPGGSVRRSTGSTSRRRLWPLPASHALRTGWSRLGHPAVERLARPLRRRSTSRTGCTRRSDGRPGDDHPRPRPAAVPRVVHAADDLDARHEVRERRPHVRPGLRQLRATRATTSSSLLGVDARADPRRASRRPRRVRARTGAADLGAPYVLTVATLEPRKNLQTLVEAHRLLGGDLLLAVAGGEGWGEQPLLDGPRIRRLGYVDDAELARLYRGAAVTVYPSRYEGFGIPIVEAHGVRRARSSPPRTRRWTRRAARRPCAPTRTTRRRSRPRSSARVAARDELVPLGLEHAARFTWRATGEILLRGFEERAGVRDHEVAIVVARDGRVPGPAASARPGRVLASRRGRRRARRERGGGGRARAGGGDRARAPVRRPRSSGSGTTRPDGGRVRLGIFRRRRARRAGSRCSTRSTSSTAGSHEPDALAMLHYPEPRAAVRRGGTAVRQARESRFRHDAARPDARGHGAPRARPARGARRAARGSSYAPLVRRAGPGLVSLPRRALVSARHRACRAQADVLHCTTFRGPLRSRAPLVVTVHDLALLRHPETFPAWHRALRTRRPACGRPRRRRRRRRLGVHRGRPIDLLGVPAERIRVVPNGVEPVFTPDGPRPRATTSSRSGRSSRARTSPGRSRRRGSQASSCASSARRGWGGVEVPGWVGLADGRGARRASTAAPAVSSTRRSTRASGSRSSRRWPVERPS